ncbi:SMC-Scp complex subunit ScpB [Kocuria flava]|uniref:SMC-Scp complex subunit ScpB n=1 Tax=Kocuria flava TaxID=446860 RepID=UPI001FF17116|nr:SMC-Scp complex subunit ScpB [Kocuria flava]MCJ8505412.1 SMC-Scp complex subunit ScpB [Kocuria flava]
MSAPAPPPGERAGPDLEALPGGLRAAVEAILMVADEPVSEYAIAAALVVPVAAVQRVLDRLRAEYDGRSADPGYDGQLEPRGFELRSTGAGWRIYSRSEFAPVVSAFVAEGQAARLSQAALETLAVVAYRQPVSRGRISAIRGVNVDGVVRTLLQRGLVREVERDAASGAVLYGTTALLLEKLGIGSLDELPDLAPHLPGIDQIDDYED